MNNHLMVSDPGTKEINAMLQDVRNNENNVVFAKEKENAAMKKIEKTLKNVWIALVTLILILGFCPGCVAESNGQNVPNPENDPVVLTWSIGDSSDADFFSDGCDEATPLAVPDPEFSLVEYDPFEDNNECAAMGWDSSFNFSDPEPVLDDNPLISLDPGPIWEDDNTQEEITEWTIGIDSTDSVINTPNPQFSEIVDPEWLDDENRSDSNYVENTPHPQHDEVVISWDSEFNDDNAYHVPVREDCDYEPARNDNPLNDLDFGQLLEDGNDNGWTIGQNVDPEPVWEDSVMAVPEDEYTGWTIGSQTSDLESAIDVNPLINLDPEFIWDDDSVTSDDDGWSIGHNQVVPNPEYDSIILPWDIGNSEAECWNPAFNLDNSETVLDVNPLTNSEPDPVRVEDDPVVSDNEDENQSTDYYDDWKTDTNGKDDDTLSNAHDSSDCATVQDGIDAACELVLESDNNIADTVVLAGVAGAVWTEAAINETEDKFQDLPIEKVDLVNLSPDFHMKRYIALVNGQEVVVREEKENHSFTGHGWEREHPHLEYDLCDCGCAVYTGKTHSVSTCELCNPKVETTVDSVQTTGSTQSSPVDSSSGISDGMSFNHADAMKIIDNTTPDEWNQTGKIRYVQQYFGGYESYYSKNYWYQSERHNCDRATAYMGLSYMGLDELPTEKDTRGSDGNAIEEVGNKYQLETVSISNASEFTEAFNSYANDTSCSHSPIMAYVPWNHGGTGYHSWLIIGTVENEDGWYWLVDPGANNYLAKVKITEKNGELRVSDAKYSRNNSNQEWHSAKDGNTSYYDEDLTGKYGIQFYQYVDNNK